MLKPITRSAALKDMFSFFGPDKVTVHYKPGEQLVNHGSVGGSGTATGTSVVAGPSFLHGISGARYFDGTSGDYLNLGTGIGIGNQHTWSFWVKFDDFTTGAVANILHPITYREGGSGDSANLLYYNNDHALYPNCLSTIYNDGSTWVSKISARVDLVAGVWYHIVASTDVANAGNSRFYVNGKVFNSSSVDQTTALFSVTTNHDLKLGYSSSSLASAKMSVSEFMILNRLVAPSEILEYYRQATSYSVRRLVKLIVPIIYSDTISESATLSDTTKMTGVLGKKLSESMSLTDTIEANRILDRKITSSMSLSDTYAYDGARYESLIDTISISDSLSRHITAGRITSDTLSISDSVIATIFINVSVSEAVTINDTVRFNNRFFLSQELLLEIELAHVWLEAQPVASANITNTIFLFKNFFGTAAVFTNNITSTIAMTRSLASLNLLVEPTAPLDVFKEFYLNLLPDRQSVAASIEYKILLDGTDVTDKVASCRITYSLDSYVGELDIDWADWTLYSQVDCSNLKNNYMIERVEVYTRVASNASPIWVLQGKFFLEKRSSSVVYNQTTLNSWGRSRPAVLSMPYAKPLTKVWVVDTTALSIADELCRYDMSKTPPVLLTLPVTLSWEVADYKVLGTNVDVESTEPIEVISTLASTVGGILTCTKEGTLRVMYRYEDRNEAYVLPVPAPNAPEINGVVPGIDYARVYFS